MLRTPYKTNRRDRSKASPNRGLSGTVPSILTVSAVGGEVNQIEITFNMTVVIDKLPAWTATVGGSPVLPVEMVSNTLTSLVLDYGEDVSTATSIVVPADSQVARSTTGQRIGPGVYPLS